MIPTTLLRSVFFTACLVVSTIQDGILSLRFHHYNAHGVLKSGSPCDWKDHKCDIGFTICFKKSSHEDLCSHSERTGQIAKDRDILDLQNSTRMGKINNPIEYAFHGSWRKTYVDIKAEDYDTVGRTQEIDHFVEALDDVSSHMPPKIIQLNGQRDFLTSKLVLSYKMWCSDQWYGEQCESQCPVALQYSCPWRSINICYNTTPDATQHCIPFCNTQISTKPCTDEVLTLTVASPIRQGDNKYRRRVFTILIISLCIFLTVTVVAIVAVIFYYEIYPHVEFWNVSARWRKWKKECNEKYDQGNVDILY